MAFHYYRDCGRSTSLDLSPGVDTDGENGPGIPTKSEWREPRRASGRSESPEFIVATRWREERNSGRSLSAPSTPGWHEIAIALKTTRLRLSRDSHCLFEGTSPAGTVIVADAALPLKIDVESPCDFIHLSVSDEWLLEAETEISQGGTEPPNLDGFTMRDAVAEALARSLIDVGAHYADRYAQSVAQTIVMRLLRAARERPKNAGAKISPLPRWRLRRVQDHIASHIERRLNLPELASVAGLSRMHFAAQFRAATGHSPHDYVLLCRTERAKAMLEHEETPIVAIALSVGFQSQAHFSTVFKKHTKETPLGWRRAGLDARVSTSRHGRRTDGEASRCLPVHDRSMLPSASLASG